MNRKGITTVELLICFILVMIITISMYTVISAYNERRILESYKEQIITYKNTLTKDIQDDLIKVGLTAATYERKVVNSAEGVPVKAVYTVDFDLRDGSQRQLVIEQTTTKSVYHPAGYDATSGTEVNDAYLIKYGDPTPNASGETPNMVEYDFPNLGSITSDETGKEALDFSINNVLINIYDEKVLSIYIGFYHPEFGTRYFIDITALIDFVFSGSEFVDASRVAYFIIYDLAGGTYPGGTNPNLISYDQSRLPYTLINPIMTGKTFDGWTGSNGTDANTTVKLLPGTTGNKSYKANWRDNYARIRYTVLSGETVHSPYTTTNGTVHYYTTVNNRIYTTNSSGGNQQIIEPYVVHGGQLSSSGLANYDGVGNSYFNITLSGYAPVSGAQWACNCTAGDTGCPCARQTYDWGVAYTAAQLCNTNASDCVIELHPNWNIANYSITYDYKDGALPRGVSNPDSYNINTATITLNNPEKAGHTFAGWTGSNGTTAQTTVTIPKGSTGNKSYTANWNKNRYSITYNAGTGGSGSVAATNCYYNETCNLAASTGMSKSGYTFAGWYTSASGGTKYGSSTQLTSNITVYAHWAITKQDFSANGNIQSYTASATGRYLLKVWGAQGGDGCRNNSCSQRGGYGGYSYGKVDLTEGQTIYVVVGKRGESGAKDVCSPRSGGYNGGGNSGRDTNCDISGNGPDVGGGGGGATHISKTNTILSGTAKSDLYIVAGGGGGGAYDGAGGNGGAANGTRYSDACGEFGNQTGGGHLNYGYGTTGIDSTGPGGGGGGGLYGGYSSGHDCPGPGGSGYIGGVASGTGSTATSDHTGDGSAQISFDSY